MMMGSRLPIRESLRFTSLLEDPQSLSRHQLIDGQFDQIKPALSPEALDLCQKGMSINFALQQVIRGMDGTVLVTTMT